MNCAVIAINDIAVWSVSLLLINKKANFFGELFNFLILIIYYFGQKFQFLEYFFKLFFALFLTFIVSVEKNWFDVVIKLQFRFVCKVVKLRAILKLEMQKICYFIVRKAKLFIQLVLLIWNIFPKIRWHFSDFFTNFSKMILW